LQGGVKKEQEEGNGQCPAGEQRRGMGGKLLSREGVKKKKRPGSGSRMATKGTLKRGKLSGRKGNNTKTRMKFGSQNREKSH